MAMHGNTANFSTIQSDVRTLLQEKGFELRSVYQSEDKQKNEWILRCAPVRSPPNK